MAEHKQGLLIIGATSAIAEHCARLWLRSGVWEVTLMARDTDKAADIARDLRVRCPGSNVTVSGGDFLDPPAMQRTIAEFFAQGPIDIALIAHGALPDQTQCENNLETANAALLLNGVSSCLFAEACAKGMTANNRGTLVVLGSVAGDRGRKTNYVYGAAKSMVDRYCQGLQHRLAASAVRVVLVKPGPTDTPMTAHLKASGMALAAVADVAQAIVRGVQAGKPVVYAPGKWRIIMLVIKHLPDFIFHRLNI